ncbi:Cullin binding-domain-containing protein [Mycena metata]|uniref:Defective in cullin neddylation protein n=1 Tax=Mycena metata TaxID=1033252 RepID=A0AAD7JW64_9AGAR|nr:Cullin binding-domain-containing protein [Mycena metata]
MPPKRKRAEDAPAAEATSSTRATRSSARQSTGSSKDDAPAAAKPAPAKKTATKAPKAAAKSSEAPAAKKAKTTASTSTTKATAKKAAPKKSKKAIEISSDGESDSFAADDEPAQIQPKPPKAAAPPAPAPTPAPAPVKAQASVSKIEPYSADRATALFKKYAEEDDPNTIGPDGFQQLCMDAQMPLEGALPLILSWQLNGSEMAKFTKQEWTKGTESLKVSSLSSLFLAISDLDKLLIQGKPAPKATAVKKDPYDKTAYNKYAADPKAAFGSLYTFCFALAKAEQSRNIEMEVSSAFWSVLLVPQYPVMSEVLEFIAEKGSYKAVNKDLWSMMLEFCRTVKPSLQDYEADGVRTTQHSQCTAFLIDRTTILTGMANALR